MITLDDPSPGSVCMGNLNYPVAYLEIVHVCIAFGSILIMILLFLLTLHIYRAYTTPRA